MRDRLAHDIRERFVVQRRDRRPAHAVGRVDTRPHARGIDHELKWKMREDMGYDTGLAMPARDALEDRCLLQRYPVILLGKPVGIRYFRHTAEQAFFRTAANQKFATARDDERRSAAQR